MPRGHAAQIGETRWSQNGYQQERTEIGWRYVHHLVMEEKLGRSLRPGERVIFLNGKKTDTRPENLVSEMTGAKTTAGLEQRKQKLEDLIPRLQLELDDVKDRLERRRQITGGVLDEAQQEDGTDSEA